MATAAATDIAQPTLVPGSSRVTLLEQPVPAKPATPIVSARITKLFDRISVRSAKGENQKADEELSRVVMLLVDVQEIDCDILACCLEIAVNRLLLPDPDVVAATVIIDSVEERLKILRHPWIGLRRGSSPAAKVVFGMTACLLFLIALSPFSGLFHAIKPDPKDFHIVPLICCLGAVGSFVSIMVRINEFAKLSKTDASVLFLTGFFKPWIGISFAFFIYVVLRSSGMSIITDGQLQGFCFVIAAAFLAGFSERFAQDVASRAQQVFGEITLPIK